ncbi:hypothetical protein TSMEX_001956 [Taenia solium]|eukprot:TsM_000248700 transcript=TsM_000248700 gene=TsM_000248700
MANQAFKSVDAVKGGERRSHWIGIFDDFRTDDSMTWWRGNNTGSSCPLQPTFTHSPTQPPMLVPLPFT